MSEPHPSRGRPPRRFGLPAVSPPLAYGIRLGIAVCTAIWIAHQPGLITNSAHWILITVLVVAQPATGGSLMKGLLRGLGTLGAFFTAILLFGRFAQDPPLLLAGLMLVQIVAAYGFTGARGQYAWFVWAFTTVIVVAAALGGGEHVETIAFQRASAVAIGLLIVVVFDSLLWPDRSEATLRASLAARARDLAAAWRGDGAAARPSPLATQLGLVAAVRSEIGGSAERVEVLSRVALLLEALAMRMQGLRARVDAVASTTARGAMETLARRCEEGLEEVAAAVAGARTPVPQHGGLDAPLLAVDAALAVGAGDAGRVARTELRADLRRAVELAGEVERAGVADATAASDASRARWRVDPLRVQIAIRTAVAVAAVLVAMLALGWPINNIALPLAFMIACTPTRVVAGKLIVGLLVSLALAWAVADLAVVTVFTEVSRVPEALVFPFLVSLGLGAAAVARPKLAPLTPIAGLLVLLPIFATGSAPTDVYGPYDTACYIVLALGVGWGATRLFWPATAAALFRRRAAALLALCAEALEISRAGDAPARRARAGRLLGAYAAQTAQIGPLHQQARLESEEPGLGDDDRAALLALIQALFDRALRRRERAETLRGRLPAALRPACAALFDAMTREERALAASVERSASALRDGVPPGNAEGRGGVGTTLAAARADVERELDVLRGSRAALAAADGADASDALLDAVGDRRALAESQLAVEAWLAGWGGAAATRPAFPAPATAPLSDPS